MPNLANGIACFGPSLFVSAAFSLSLTSSSLCNYLVLDGDNVWRGPPFNVRAIGFWCYEQTDGNRYSYANELDNYDSAFESARAMGLVANIMGFCVLCIYIISGCIPLPAIAWYVTGLAALLTGFFEGMKFMMLQSELFCDGSGLGCSYYKGGRCSIASIVLWFVASLMTCAMGKQRKEERHDNRDERQEDNRQEDDDKKGKDDDKKDEEQAADKPKEGDDESA